MQSSVFFDYHPELHSFPTRRSSDLQDTVFQLGFDVVGIDGVGQLDEPLDFAVSPLLMNELAGLFGSVALGRDAESILLERDVDVFLDLKSTRLNSSHLGNSDAVFCVF